MLFQFTIPTTKEVKNYFWGTEANFMQAGAVFKLKPRKQMYRFL